MLGVFTSDQVAQDEGRGLRDCASVVPIDEQTVRAAKAKRSTFSRSTKHAVDEAEYSIERTLDAIVLPLR